MPNTHANNNNNNKNSNSTSRYGVGKARTQGQTQHRHGLTSMGIQHPTSQNTIDCVTAEATCRKLVSVLALDAGFEGITASALETLTRTFENYTQQLYSIAHSFAELETPLLRGPLQETIAKHQRKKEKKTVLLDSDIEDNTDSDDEEPATTSLPETKVTARTIVPDHLPPFPSKHSYKQTPVFVKRPTDPQKIRELNAEQSRLVESNLKRLMAAENKVAMAAAHKDGSSVGVTTDLLMVKEEPESEESIDRRALTKLEALPVVNYEFSRRQQQLSASKREGNHQAQLHEMQGGHRRGESLSSNLNGGGGAAGGSVLTLKAEWRKGRRRMRKEQQDVMEELEHNLNHKRLRQESSHSRDLAKHLCL
ncbi:hypothetical protein BGZ65_006136 [Modicella reniformis]|uniref:Transcription initiation factor TFIID subunit 8 n=1 Tax=Modicella reniformis TaxID=1440133 RepID=A0A9P6J581_9FUNG|nr:hypothetical protein BGZ65_006136 [Modicella reniformis]